MALKPWGRELERELDLRKEKFADPSRVVALWPGVPPVAKIAGGDGASWWRQSLVDTVGRLVVAAGEIIDHPRRR